MICTNPHIDRHDRVGIFSLTVPNMAGQRERLRFAINSGTHRLPVSARAGTAYEGGIYLPNDDWRPLDSIEQLHVFDCQPSSDPSIRLFQISREIYADFWKQDISFLKDKSKLDARSRVLTDLLRRIAAQIPTEQSARSATIILRPAGIPSSTFDNVHNLFIGLHVDDNDADPISDRKCSRPRSLVNLGKETRYFNFLTPIISHIHTLCDCPSTIASYELAHRFMSLFPKWPVVRIALDPSEGYIAPTQLIIHDGYTVGMTTPDITFTCLL
jgi:hypothetical protein